MNKNHRYISPLLATFLALMLSATGLMAQQKALLFGDTFNRPSTNDVNDSIVGQQGPLAPLNYYSTAYTLYDDEINKSSVGIVANSLGIDGVNDGNGGGLVYPEHNFTDAVILTDGGFSVTVDIAQYSTGGSGRRMTVGVGQKVSELLAIDSAEVIQNPADLAVAYRYTTQDLEIYNNGILNVAETVIDGLPVAPTTMRIEYSLSSFASGSPVTYEVFFDDAATAFTSGSFDWSGTDENYISLISNLSNPSRFDNLQIRGGSTSGDFIAPTPDPLTWASVPTADNSTTISMTATTAYDDNGVEYYFENTTVTDGSHDSGWQSSSSYTDTNLTAQTTYSYTVAARDKSVNANETTVLIAVLVTTPALDDTPPNPDPMTWASVPATVNRASITMTATTATDVNDVQYYFSNTTVTNGSHDSGWQDSPTYIDLGLTAETTYTYTVMARDTSPDGMNETAASTEASATTDAAPALSLIAGVDFEDDDNTMWDSTPDDLDPDDGITVSEVWTVVGADMSVKSDNGANLAGATSGDFVGKLDKGTVGVANPPATTPAEYFSWTITIPEGVVLNLTAVTFDWRQGTGTSATRWGMFNTSLDGGPDGGTPVWSMGDPPNRNEGWENVNAPLIGSQYEGLSGTNVTFYWYNETTGSDIDTIKVYGSMATATPVDDLSIEVLGSEVGLGWYGEAGGSYNLQISENLIVGDWDTITNIAGANADILVLDDSDKTNAFYRVKLVE